MYKLMTIKPSHRVKDLETGVEGTVESNLATQKTVQWDDGRFSFIFNKEEGVEWETVGKLPSEKSDYKMFFTGKTIDSISIDDVMMDLDEMLEEEAI